MREGSVLRSGAGDGCGANKTSKGSLWPVEGGDA
jgi:hypothetical protein